MLLGLHRLHLGHSQFYANSHSLASTANNRHTFCNHLREWAPWRSARQRNRPGRRRTILHPGLEAARSFHWTNTRVAVGSPPRQIFSHLERSLQRIHSYKYYLVVWTVFLTTIHVGHDIGRTLVWTQIGTIAPGAVGAVNWNVDTKSA